MYGQNSNGITTYCGLTLCPRGNHMYSILDDIKNNSLKKVYLLFGEEQYLVRVYLEKLVKACMGKDLKSLEGDMNFVRFSGTATDVKEVEENANTMPFFAEKRMIVAQGTGWFHKSSDEVASFIASIPETACVVFAENDVDKRSNTYKAVEKYGHAANFEELKEEDVKKWICREVDRNRKKITNGAVDALIAAAGCDLAALSTELEKCFSYCLDKDAIERADVESLVHVQAQDRVFEMIEFVGLKKQKEALKCYYDLLELRVPPMKILANMQRQFRLLIAVKDLKGRGLDKNRIAEELAMKPFIVQKYMNQAGHFSMSDLKKALQEAADYDMAFKNGGISDRMAVELLLIQYSA